MHELSEIKNIINTITAKVKGKNRISKIHLGLSAASHMKEDSFRKTFTIAAKGTVLENAKLDIKRLPVTVICKSCSKRFNTTRPILNCIYCKADKLDVKLPREEILVESVEVPG